MISRMTRLSPDASLEHPDQVVPPEIAEEPANVGVNDPADLPPFHSDRHGVERIVRPTPRSEPVAEPEELRLVDRHQNRVRHRLLDDLVLQRGDAERSLPPVLLGYVHPPGRRRAVRSPVQPSMQVDQSVFQPFGIHFPRHAIHASGDVTLERVERFRQHGHRDVVQERNKTLFRVPLCSLSYPVGRL